jgi:hypothetical protein
VNEGVASFIAEVMQVAHQLGLPGWQVVALTLAAAVVYVLGRRGAKAIANMPLPPPPWDPEKGTGTVDLELENPQDNKPKGWE